jgi:Raf kinase inhibitor-like YbhB/YbcL family protein
MAREFLTAATLALMLTIACGSSAGSPASSGAGRQGSSLTVSSPDLTSGVYSRELTCDGSNRPPAVSWARGPGGTRAIVIELLDPDAPGGMFTHWLAVLDGRATGRLAHPFPGSLVQGKNSVGGPGYSGPCPPAGPAHHYHLIVLAVSSRPGLVEGFSKDQLDAVLDSGQVSALARGELVATYQRA